MKTFKTIVITKKTILRFIIVCVVIITCITIFFILKNRNKSVSVYSDFAIGIIDEGTANEDDKKFKDIASDILGFDMDDPVSIIDSASPSFSDDATPVPTQTSSPTQTPEVEKETQDIPSYDEIINNKGLKISNSTDYDVNLDDYLREPLEVKLDLNSPEVLIVHTHTTECYNGDAMSGEAERTTNEEYNMCKIGSVVAKTLEGHGIKTIHDKTIHDYPSFQSAYARALKTIEKNISQYPSIKVVLDIHRDAYIYPDGRKLRVTTKYNNEDVAQVMLVLGTDSMGLEHSNWKSNLSLAAKIQSAADIMYPDMMRPLNLRRERFNMHATKGSLLLEIGSNGNSLDEAERSAEYIANAIAAVLVTD